MPVLGSRRKETARVSHWLSVQDGLLELGCTWGSVGRPGIGVGHGVYNAHPVGFLDAQPGCMLMLFDGALAYEVPGLRCPVDELGQNQLQQQYPGKLKRGYPGQQLPQVWCCYQGHLDTIALWSAQLDCLVHWTNFALLSMVQRARARLWRCMSQRHAGRQHRYMHATGTQPQHVGQPLRDGHYLHLGGHSLQRRQQNGLVWAEPSRGRPRYE